MKDIEQSAQVYQEQLEKSAQDHQSWLLGMLNSQREDSALADLEFRFPNEEGITMRVQSDFIRARCLYFDSLLKFNEEVNTDMTDESKRVITIDHYTSRAFKAALDYLYTGLLNFES